MDELAYLKVQISDLEYHVSEQHTLLIEARELLQAADGMVDDAPRWRGLLESWLRRLPR